MRNLIGLCLIERLVEPPDVGLLNRKSVSRPVGKDDNLFAHNSLRLAKVRTIHFVQKSMTKISATLASLACGSQARSRPTAGVLFGASPQPREILSRPRREQAARFG